MNSLPRYSDALALLISASVLAGCIGNMRGVVRDHGGNVNVSNSGDMYTISLPDGEIFTGKRIQQQTPKLIGSNANLLESPKIRSPFGDVTYYYYSFGYYQRALTHGGILLGDRGHAMWCNIYVTGFGGGKGLCDISDGRTIDLHW